MIVELSRYDLSVLQAGAFTLYRGRGNDIDPILLVVPSEEHPPPESAKRLQHEYALRTELDPSWAAVPLKLATHHHRPALVLRDPGGQPLDRLLGHAFEQSEFLRIAIPLAAACRRMHERSVIHKDIKPANVLVKVHTGGVWLSGFGIASSLPREHQSPGPPEVIAGTLPYMAPEQTGRMNRSVDSRSDLYALGVIFYEMLTGSRPFAASDPMELIHCHIARQPIPPRERNTEIPEQIASITMRLLAKAPEERYQSAVGVEADLRRCLAQCQSSGRVDSFPLGADDAHDRLLIPEKLYGRDQEIGTLLAAFDRVVAGGTPELVLVSGYSGIGKSSVVNELHKALVPHRGLFASGKFDQYKRDIPYTTLVQAFQSLVRDLLSKSNTELASWRHALQEALNPNGRLLVDLIPELKFIIGDQPPAPELPPQQAQSRFHLVLRRFIAVFARPEHPLALFLDDLQWLDAATLDLLEDLLTRSDLLHLMLIGAYRDNEVAADHPLMRKLDAIRTAGGKFVRISLAPLVREHLAQLIADTLHCGLEHAAPLAAVVHDKTGGNPFFAIQFLSSLAEEGLLTFDYDGARWCWDLNRIKDKGYTESIVDLMVAKLTRLPAETQHALQQLACFGNSAEITTFSIVLGIAEEQVDAVLWPALRQELVERIAGVYRFVHDRVREAAYSLIPQEVHAEAHLRIGRLLATHTSVDEREGAIFEIVNQLNYGVGLITDRGEREQLAELNLMAGQRAKASTAYASALNYLTVGAALLGEDSWNRRHELAFRLELHRVECEFLTGCLAEAEERLKVLLPKAATTTERAAAACLGIDLYTTLGQSSRAVVVGLEYLRHLGVEWSPHPTDEDVRREYGRMWSLLGRRAVEELIDLPLMTDAESRATVDVLIKTAPAALFTDWNLHCLVLCRTVNLSLEHGNSDASCLAYTFIATVLGPHFGNYDAAYRFGLSGLQLAEKRGLNRFEARVYLVFGNLVNPWARHIRMGPPLLRRAFEVAERTGDLNCMVYSRQHLVTNLLACGTALDEVQREAEAGLELAHQARFDQVVNFIAAQLGSIRSLRGLTTVFGRFDQAGFDEQEFERHLSDPRRSILACWFWIRKLQARFLSGDHAAAMTAAVRAEQLLPTFPFFIERAEFHLYAALARAARYDAASAGERVQYLEALAAHHQQFEQWEQNCPENFENCAALVGAEIARIEDRTLDAMDLYERAIRSAQANGFIHNEALANELAARFYAARGFERIAQVYVRTARDCYRSWGADGKVRQLEQDFPILRDEPASIHSDAPIGTRVEHLDLATVVKALQAVSTEIELRKLIDTLMVIALEHAGADRGLLILPREDELWIEAEATAVRDAITVNMRQEDASRAQVPQAVLRYVMRTHDRVLLDDTAPQSPFSADEHIKEKRCRSLLCIPLIKQSSLIGILYLENGRTSQVFTPARVTVLELLASQAAISLQNSRLYADLTVENRERRKAEEQLRASEASLAEGQRISHTGTWRWSVESGVCQGSAETFRIFGLDPAEPLSFAKYLECVHPEDRAAVEQALARASGKKSVFTYENRIVRPDGSIRYVQSTGHPTVDESGELDFVGTVMDITERRLAEEALRRTQDELARKTRLTTMGELAGSIIHEINQPLAAVVGNAQVCLRWLNRDRPDLAEAREAAASLAKDGLRVAEVVRGLMTLARKSGLELTDVDINDAIREVLVLLRGELERRAIVPCVDLVDIGRPVFGDRVQLQQVLLNLIRNGIEAMSTVTDRPRILKISSQPSDREEIVIAVEDVGTGLDTGVTDRIFEPLFTTKPDGMGMGLAICRSIIEAHHGRLWASPNLPHGTVFRFTIPLTAQRHLLSHAEDFSDPSSIENVR
jgi:PAS domain S-box-containing protein